MYHNRIARRYVNILISAILNQFACTNLPKGGQGWLQDACAGLNVYGLGGHLIMYQSGNLCTPLISWAPPANQAIHPFRQWHTVCIRLDIW